MASKCVHLFAHHTGQGQWAGHLAKRLEECGAQAQVFTCPGSPIALLGSSEAVRVVNSAELQHQSGPVGRADAVITMMSPLCDDPSRSAEMVAFRVAQGYRTPLFGVGDWQSSRSPSWSGIDDLSEKFDRYFSFLPDDGYHGDNHTVVGPAQLDPYLHKQGWDPPTLAAEARRRLGIDQGERVLWVICHPEPETARFVHGLMTAFKSVMGEAACLIFSRHPRMRDGSTGRISQTRALLSVLNKLRVDGLKVIDHSLRFGMLGKDDPHRIRRQHYPRDWASIIELLALCHEQGVVATGFSTDGLVVAPFLGVPSVLYLGPDGYGPHWEREKQRAELFDQTPRLIQRAAGLEGRLQMLFGDGRAAEMARLGQMYPRPLQPPSQAIAEAVMRALN